MGSGHRSGFVVDKGEATECDFGLGLKMMMMGNHQHHHHSHSNDQSGTKFVGFSGDHHHGSSSPAAAGGGSGGGGGGGGFGAMFSSNNNSNQESTTAITTSSTSSVYGGGASSVASSVQRSSHAFDPSSFKSWGGGPLMGLGGGEMTRVFTASQRQELERQTIIYKYMAASVPVPPELLIAMNSKYPSQLSLPPYQSNDHVSSGGKSAVDLRYTLGSRDGEPWRCRRTDGKKWRCSRDVAPDQKYCERHSHKGRPSRSRKHVESSSTSSSSTSSSISIARNNNNNNITLMPPSSSASSAANPANINIRPSFLYQPSPSMFLSHQHQNPSQSRFPEWFMKREADHSHDQSSGGSVPTASPFFPQTELDQMTPTHSPTLPRQFLDAWSIGPKPDNIVEITGKPTYSGSSLLTLSMAGGGIEDNEEAAARLGMRLFHPERERDVGGNGGGGEGYSWMGSSAPGGPLAEALCLGIVGADGGGGRGRGTHGHGESGGGDGHGLGFNK